MINLCVTWSIRRKDERKQDLLGLKRLEPSALVLKNLFGILLVIQDVALSALKIMVKNSYGINLQKPGYQVKVSAALMVNVGVGLKL